MKNLLWKLAVQTVVPVLCGLILVNAYAVWMNLQSVQRSAGLRADTAETQKAIANVGLDLQTMETSQRGYLLTGDASYLKPYNAAGERLTGHLGELRSRLDGNDRALEGQVESLAQAKIAEMKETIRLREQGYRHRAFLIVGSNQGQQLMDKARAALDALSSAQANKVVEYEQELNDGLHRAARESAYASGILLAVALAVFVAFNGYRSGLERRQTRLDEQLRTTSLQLQQLSSTVFKDVRVLLGEFQNDADALLNAYGGFLPGQAHEKMVHIEEGAVRMIRVLDCLTKLPAEEAKDGSDRASVQALSA